jgi:hypothetical protein
MNDSHWFVIPADKEDKWSEWCEVAEKNWWNMPELPEWAVEAGGSPSLVTFVGYKIT